MNLSLSVSPSRGRAQNCLLRTTTEFRGKVKCSKNEAMKNYNLFFLKHNLWIVIKVIDWMDSLEAFSCTDIAKDFPRWKCREMENWKGLKSAILNCKSTKISCFCWAAQLEPNRRNCSRLKAIFGSKTKFIGTQGRERWSYDRGCDEKFLEVMN